NESGNVEKLKGNVDLNFSASYLLNKNISFFAEVNNALSLKSERWYKYPGYGFLALGGVLVSF
ncbi:MAG: TonB-dependent receptor, partial [Bacteroidetes bacterium]|nr:TonB-dependent receptor [Bacteroidota bacterium]